jgi:hypothetical protein
MGTAARVVTVHPDHRGLTRHYTVKFDNTASLGSALADPRPGSLSCTRMQRSLPGSAGAPYRQQPDFI